MSFRTITLCAPLLGLVSCYYQPEVNRFRQRVDQSVVLKEDIYVNKGHLSRSGDPLLGTRGNFLLEGEQRVAVLKKGEELHLVSRRNAGGFLFAGAYTTFRCQPKRKPEWTFDFVAGVDGKINHKHLPWYWIPVER